MSLGRPILEYGLACWDPYREYQISALDRVQNKAAKFTHRSEGSDWESLAQRWKIARICALYKGYTGERAWKAIEERLEAPVYLSRVDHHWKIRARNKEQTAVNTPFCIGPLLTGTCYLKWAIGTSHVKKHI